MRIDFYSITDAPNKIRKGIGSPVLSLDGTLKENCSVMDPIIKIDNNGFIGCNYAFIEEFNRWYHIKDAVSIRNNIWEIHMHIDVLYTYANGILAAPCVVAKSTNKFNLYLNDPNYKCYQDPLLLSYDWPDGFSLSQSSYVLTIFGEKE